MSLSLLKIHKSVVIECFYRIIETCNKVTSISNFNGGSVGAIYSQRRFILTTSTNLGVRQTIIAIASSAAIIAIAGVTVGILTHLEETAGFKLADVLSGIAGKCKS